MVFNLIKQIINLLMHLVMLILKQKTNYLMAPDTVLNTFFVAKVLRMWHFFPSALFSVLVVVKIFPLISFYYVVALENNSGVIPATVLACFLVALVINGIIIEKVLEHTNAGYAAYKQSLIR